MRRTPIARTGPPDVSQQARKPRKALPAVSAARRAEKTVRARLVARLAVDGVVCEICPELARYGVVVPGGCSGLGGLHERRKRSAVGTVEHAPNLIPACNLSNGWIETVGNDELRRFGVFPWLVVIEGDDEWESCGRDVDPEPVEVKLCQRCGDAYVTVPPSGFLACGHRPGL